jgi:hypothetical protein
VSQSSSYKSLGCAADKDLTGGAAGVPEAKSGKWGFAKLRNDLGATSDIEEIEYWDLD